ncbi:hypothetical protein MASR2M17_16400 [Aminivibrio sp.]
MFENIFAGFSSILTITNITLIFLGTFAGIIVGALPGLSTTMGIALCVPFTFGMDPLSGLALLPAFPEHYTKLHDKALKTVGISFFRHIDRTAASCDDIRRISYDAERSRSFSS